MPKIRLRQAVSFDGKTFPAGHVFDTDSSPISAECLIQREWGEVVSEDSAEAPADPASSPVDDADEDSEPGSADPQDSPADELPDPEVISADVIRPKPPKHPRKK